MFKSLKTNSITRSLAEVLFIGGVFLLPPVFGFEQMPSEPELGITDHDSLFMSSQNSYHWDLGEDIEKLMDSLVSFEGTTLMSVSGPAFPPPKVAKRIKVMATAYSSTVDQTDSNPFITAAGTHVRDGIVAANFVPLGTEIRLPELFGNRIFVVEDRMHKRKRYQVDIWFPEREQALDFGAKLTIIEVLES